MEKHRFYFRHQEIIEVAGLLSRKYDKLKKDGKFFLWTFSNKEIKKKIESPER